jgi:hypothetical protein
VGCGRKSRFAGIVLFEARLCILMILPARIGKVPARIWKLFLLLMVEKMCRIEARSGIRTAHPCVISQHRAAARQFTQWFRQFAIS